MYFNIYNNKYRYEIIKGIVNTIEEEICNYCAKIGLSTFFDEDQYNEGKYNDINRIKIENEELLDCILYCLFKKRGKSAAEYLKFFDLEGFELKLSQLCNLDLSFVNANISFDYLKNKDLTNTYFVGTDLSKNCFDDMMIRDSDFRGTKANIDPQKVANKGMGGCNVSGLDFTDKSFANVYVGYADLSNIKGGKDLDKVFNKVFLKTNLTGVDLSNIDFAGFDLQGSNLENTNAKINLDSLSSKDLSFCNLKGCTIYHDETITKFDFSAAKLPEKDHIVSKGPNHEAIVTVKKLLKEFNK